MDENGSETKIKIQKAACPLFYFLPIKRIYLIHGLAPFVSDRLLQRP
jgi:hypothetical protein